VLEVQIANQEDMLRRQRAIVQCVVPALADLYIRADNSNFTVRLYEGEEGFKQVCWHELKAKGELLAITSAKQLSQTRRQLLMIHLFYFCSKRAR